MRRLSPGSDDGVRDVDAGLLAHVAFVQDGDPVVVPMLYGRDGETLYLHGARKARVIRLLEGTGTACINVTLLDGLVFARSAFASSMNYRSATVYGNARVVDDWEDKKRALNVIAECTMPGRRAELRKSTDNELKMTGVIAVDIESASAKISDKMPDDEACDIDTPCIDPEVSTMKMVSRGICAAGTSFWSGGMTMSRWYGLPSTVSLNAIARGSAEGIGRHTSSKSWSMTVCWSVSSMT